MSGNKTHYVIGPISWDRGLATSVSMIIIFFSLTLVSTITYYYSATRIDAKKEDLKVIAAEEKMLDLEAAISSTAWSPGSSRVLAFSDYGGEVSVKPPENHLEINITMGESSYIVFNGSTGSVIYKLPFASKRQVGRWLLGDDRAIVNRSSAYQAQVHVEHGDERQELTMGYRPLVSSSLGGMASGRRVNNIRIYIINLNGSQALSSEGEFHLKVQCTGVSTSLNAYNHSASVTSANIRATLDGSEEEVEVPITSGPSGSTVRVEVLVCHIEARSVRV